MDVPEDEHVIKSIFTPRFVAASSFEASRVFESAEQNVPDRNVREIISVVTKLMMHPMGLRPLKNKSEPGGRMNIPVVEELTDCDQDRIVASRAHAGPEKWEHDQAAEN